MTTSTLATEAPALKRITDKHRVPIIDCDIHTGVHDEKELLSRMSPYFRARGVLTLNRNEYPNPHGGGRQDARPADFGGWPAMLKAQLLDRYDIGCGILTGGMTRVSVLPDLDYAADLLRAYNDYQAEFWMPVDDRLCMFATLPINDPAASVKEIHRLAGNPRIIGAMTNSTTQMPMGNRFYHPVYAALEEVGWPLALHPGGEGTGMSHAPTASGYPTTYLEWHTDLSAAYMTQACSAICEGIFEKFPRFKVILVEGGISWAPHLMWRLDKNWKGLRDTVPWLKRLPSEYFKEHVFFTTQPMEEPSKPQYLDWIYEMMGGDSNILFSSDYPHWDFDDPVYGLPNWSPERKERIFLKNALNVFNLPFEPKLPDL